ncbi:hypothetical protein C7M84_008206 [Penaeus vannamei]|uniref:Uncharacterized protein n=1 Tax=Penaeus vannamei TaxID=6689 RepID=A0A3R7PPV9_PENVA|nr:hypothetical protein C7M84_008206 [Penaeus vannamei]
MMFHGIRRLPIQRVESPTKKTSESEAGRRAGNKARAPFISAFSPPRCRRAPRNRDFIDYYTLPLSSSLSLLLPTPSLLSPRFPLIPYPLSSPLSLSLPHSSLPSFPSHSTPSLLPSFPAHSYPLSPLPFVLHLSFLLLVPVSCLPFSPHPLSYSILQKPENKKGKAHGKKYGKALGEALSVSLHSPGEALSVSSYSFNSQRRLRLPWAFGRRMRALGSCGDEVGDGQWELSPGSESRQLFKQEECERAACLSSALFLSAAGIALERTVDLKGLCRRWRGLEAEVVDGREGRRFCQELVRSNTQNRPPSLPHRLPSNPLQPPPPVPLPLPPSPPSPLPHPSPPPSPVPLPPSLTRPPSTRPPLPSPVLTRPRLRPPLTPLHPPFRQRPSTASAAVAFREGYHGHFLPSLSQLFFLSSFNASLPPSTFSFLSIFLSPSILTPQTSLTLPPLPSLLPRPSSSFPSFFPPPSTLTHISLTLPALPYLPFNPSLPFNSSLSFNLSLPSTLPLFLDLPFLSILPLPSSLDLPPPSPPFLP